MWGFELPSGPFAFTQLILSPDNPVSREGPGDDFSAASCSVAVLSDLGVRSSGGDGRGEEGTGEEKGAGRPCGGPRLCGYLSRGHSG